MVRGQRDDFMTRVAEIAGRNANTPHAPRRVTALGREGALLAPGARLRLLTIPIINHAGSDIALARACTMAA
jgi:hypothetical protein